MSASEDTLEGRHRIALARELTAAAADVERTAA